MTTRYQVITIISSLILCAIVAFLLSLGMWQLSRMEEKKEQQALLTKVESKSTLSFTEFVDQQSFSTVANGTRIYVNGEVDTKQAWLLDNQIHNKQVGYKVLANILTPRGTFLADFGWIKAQSNRQDFPQINLPKTITQATAIVTYPSRNAFVNNSFTETMQINGTKISRIQAVSEELGPVLSLMDDVDEFQRFWIPIVMPPEKHLAYAIQWFGLAIAAGVIGFLRLRQL